MTEHTARKSTGQECRLVPLPQAGSWPAEWDSVVKRLRGGSMHSLAWARYISTSFGVPCFFLITRGGLTVAAGWYVLSGKLLGGRTVMKRFCMETLPCLDPERISPQEVFQEVRAQAIREKCVTLEFGNSEPDYVGPETGCHVARKISFSIDLADPVEVICSRFHRQHQKRIKKAAGSGLRVEALTGEAPGWVDSLEAMYQYTYRRHVSVHKNRNQPRETSIREAVSCLVSPGHAVLFAALLGDEPVSFNIVSVFNGTAQGIFQASSEKGYALGASYLLNRKKIEYFKERGYRSFSIGEVPQSAENTADPDHGLYLYKAGYGARTKTLCSGSLVLRPAAHAAYRMIKRGRSAARRVRGLVTGPGDGEGQRTE